MTKNECTTTRNYAGEWAIALGNFYSCHSDCVRPLAANLADDGFSQNRGQHDEPIEPATCTLKFVGVADFQSFSLCGVDWLCKI